MHITNVKIRNIKWEIIFEFINFVIERTNSEKEILFCINREYDNQAIWLLFQVVFPKYFWFEH